jgi:hypothetical protein
VTQLQNLSQIETLSRCCKVVVMINECLLVKVLRRVVHPLDIDISAFVALCKANWSDCSVFVYKSQVG